MLDEIIAVARALPPVSDFFRGQTLPRGFAVPSDILLYCHDFPWPKTIVSSRYMLVFPLTELTYRIEDDHYRLCPGQTILVKPYLSRSVPPMHPDYSRLIVSFVVEGSQAYLPREPVATVTGAAWIQVRRLMEHYRRGEIIPAAFSLTLLLGELARHSAVPEHKMISSMVKRSMLLINQYLGESFGIKDIADKTGVSASHLRRQFRRELGVSLGKYIDGHRLEAAQRLLMETDQRIEAVATACGYTSVYAFSRFFRNHTGLAPSHFRQRFRLDATAGDASCSYTAS